VRTPFLLQHLLERSARRYPDRPAVAFGGETLSYAALEEQSSRLATFLRIQGVRPGDRVGLLLPKSAAAITSIFGVLKAGAVYVPLDRAAPAARLGFILRDCGVACLLAGPDESLRGGPAILRQTLDTLLVVDGEAQAAPAGPPARRTYGWQTALGTRPDPAVLEANPSIETDLAYILYTSGSTGEPKGVMISHLNALTFVRWSVSAFGVSPEDRLSNHAPFHFDLSVFDIFVAIATGASVHPVPEGLSTFPVRLASWIEEAGITVWYSVPSALSLLALHGRLDQRRLALRLVLFAGEVFPLKHLQTLVAQLPAPRYFNLYGPTETNVCTYHEVDRATLAARAAPIPIGRPCANMSVLAVTENGREVERPGEVGELVVRGSGVALGYWGQPERTAQRFVQNLRETRFRDLVYRTGDLVTVDEQGEYVYLGRADQQIKSRGYRIELGEIENALYEHPAVREAAVIAVPDDLVGNRIKAVVVPANGADLSAGDLQAHCAGRLPRYMIPEVVEFRGHLPRTLNGKVDRRELIGSLR